MSLLLRIFLFLSIGFYGCIFEERYESLSLQLTSIKENLGYDLTSPDNRYNLPFVLEEVSGLAWLGNNQLSCIQDEEGKVFIYDLIQESVVFEHKFGVDGDYEGITFYKGYFYVVDSKGTIFQFADPRKNPDTKVEETNTELKSQNNIEGLTLSTDGNHLLIACKGEGDIEGEKVKGKAVYSFNLSTKKLNLKPFISISKNDIEDFQKKNSTLFEGYSSTRFSPSAIAIHPDSKETYILSANHPMLIVLNPKKKIKAMTMLDRELFRQPEGICFTDDGELLIASEGDGGRGYILKFNQILP